MGQGPKSMFKTPFPAYLETTGCWKHVTIEMTKIVQKQITPIYEMESLDIGHAWGSGTYLSVAAATYLLTNEHVAKKMLSTPIAHLPRDGAAPIRVTNPMQAKGAPVDAAMSRIDEAALEGSPTRPVPARKFDLEFAPADYELFFICGYPGYSSPKFATQPNRRSTYFGALNTPSQPYLSQQVPLPNRPECNDEDHFAISYPNEGAMALTMYESRVAPRGHPEFSSS
jgi:hypothetical protein